VKRIEINSKEVNSKNQKLIVYLTNVVNVCRAFDVRRGKYCCWLWTLSSGYCLQRTRTLEG